MDHNLTTWIVFVLFLILFSLLISILPQLSNPIINIRLRPEQIKISEQHKSILHLLAQFDLEAIKHNIQYRIEFGSLLGYARSGNIISHDSDIDILIDPTSLPILDQLTLNQSTSSSWYVNANQHPPLPVPISQDMNNTTSIFLHRTNHQQDFTQIQRTNCLGNPVKSMKDACSFSGPVSRIILFHRDNLSLRKKKPYIDIYISGCNYHKPFGKYKTYHCRTLTKSCTFCPSTDALENSLLKQSGGALKRCTFGSVVTNCPLNDYWTNDYLKKIYGGSWKIPNRHWKYSDRPSKRRL